MNESTGGKDDLPYEYEVEFDGDTIELGIHYQNSIREPRICWRANNGEFAGKWATLKIPDHPPHPVLTPYVTDEVAEPQLVFGRFETERPTFGDETRDSISLPEDLATDLRDRLEQLGRISDPDRVSDDPTAFPETINDPDLPLKPAEWAVIGWDKTTNIMWYELANFPSTSEGWAIEWEEEQAQSPRAYQIEDGDLILRKHYWLDISRPDDDSLIPPEPAE